LKSILVFENYPTDGAGNLGLEANLNVQPTSSILSRTNYALTLLAFPGAELQLNLVYDSDRFNTANDSQDVGHLQTILTELVADPARKLAELPLLTTSERSNARRMEPRPKASMKRTSAFTNFLRNKRRGFQRCCGRVRRAAANLRRIERRAQINWRITCAGSELDRIPWSVSALSDRRT